MLVDMVENPLADAVGEHQQITIGILDKDLPLTGFAVPRLAPDFARPEIDRPISGSQIGQNGADVPQVNLKHRTLAQGILHRACLESAVPLAKHDLLPFGMLQGALRLYN